MTNINYLYIFFAVVTFILSIAQIKFSNIFYKEDYFKRLSTRFGKIDKEKAVKFESITTLLMSVIFLIGGLLNLPIKTLAICILILAVAYTIFRKTYITK